MRRVGTTAIGPTLKYFDAKSLTAQEAHKPPKPKPPKGVAQKQVITFCNDCLHYGIPLLPASSCGNCGSESIRLFQEV
jgi:hypothetical protein